MNVAFSEIEYKIGEMLAEHPERGKDPKKLFEEVSDIHIGDNVKVDLHMAKGNEFNLVLSPDPKSIKKLIDDGKDEGLYFRSLFFNPNEKVEEQDVFLPRVVSTRAWLDKEFMTLLENDPREALSNVVEMGLSDTLTINVYKDTPDTIHLNIPPKAFIAGELGDAELSQVTGGGILGDIFTVVSCLTPIGWTAAAVAQVGPGLMKKGTQMTGEVSNMF